MLASGYNISAGAQQPPQQKSALGTQPNLNKAAPQSGYVWGTGAQSPAATLPQQVTQALAPPSGGVQTLPGVGPITRTDPGVGTLPGVGPTTTMAPQGGPNTNPAPMSGYNISAGRQAPSAPNLNKAPAPDPMGTLAPGADVGAANAAYNAANPSGHIDPWMGAVPAGAHLLNSGALAYDNTGAGATSPAQQGLNQGAMSFLNSQQSGQTPVNATRDPATGAVTMPAGTGTGLTPPAAPNTNPAPMSGYNISAGQSSPTPPPAPNTSGGMLASALGSGAPSPTTPASGFPSASQNYANLQTTTPGQDLTTQTILPGQGLDRTKLAQSQLSTLDQQLQPYFNRDVRSAADNAAAGGQTNSGMLRSSLGDVTNQYALERQGAGQNYMQNAQEGSIGDMYRNLGILQQQQGFQAGQQNNAFNQGLESQNAGYANNPAQYDMLLSQLYGNNAAAAGQGVSGLIQNSTLNNAMQNNPLWQMILQQQGGGGQGQIPQVNTQGGSFGIPTTLPWGG